MTKTDKLIFWSVLSISFLFLLCSNLLFQGTGTKMAVIEVDGTPYASYRMESISSPKILSVSTEFGNQEIEVTNEYIRIVHSDCKDGLCIGTIQQPGEMLICLPHKLIVRIEANMEVDRVAY